MNKIQQLRKLKNMSQLKLAQRLQVSQSTVAKWETGETKPRADKFLELAKILDCSIDELFSIT